MTYQERRIYQTTASDLKTLAANLKGNGYRPARIEAARQATLKAAREIEEAISEAKPEWVREPG